MSRRSSFSNDNNVATQINRRQSSNTLVTITETSDNSKIG